MTSHLLYPGVPSSFKVCAHSVRALFVVIMMDVFSCKVLIRLKNPVVSSFFTGKSMMSSMAMRLARTILLYALIAVGSDDGTSLVVACTQPFSVLSSHPKASLRVQCRKTPSAKKVIAISAPIAAAGQIIGLTHNPRKLLLVSPKYTVSYESYLLLMYLQV